MRFYDLFAGIGGFHKGLEQASDTFKCVGACEINDPARNVYNEHWPDVRIDADAADLDRLPRGTELLCAGFPCQPFSLAGRRLGFEDKRGGMFAEIARLAADRRVPYVLLENVPGILSNDSGLTFATILRTLDECGYDVQWISINGLGAVPQTRERVLIVASARGERAPQVLSLAEGDRWDREARQKARQVQGASSLTTACGKYQGSSQNVMLEYVPPSLREPAEHSTSILESYYKQPAYDHPSVLVPLNLGAGDAQRIYDAGGAGRTLKAESGGQGGKTGLYAIPFNTAAGEKNPEPARDEGGPSYALTADSRRGVAVPVYGPGNTNCNGRGYREDGDASYTLTASDRHCVGVPAQAGAERGLFRGMYHVRRLTPLECERLMGFPDGWTTAAGSDSNRYRCIGNAVIPRVVEAVARKIAEVA